LGLLLKRLAVAALCLAATVALAGPGTQRAPTPKLLATGKDIYTINCVTCHGATGDGKGPLAFAVKPPPRDFTKDAFKAGDGVEQIFKTVTSGLPKTQMTGFPQLTEEQRWAVAYYVRAFRVAK
jgi:high-affinity iron transporter